MRALQQQLAAALDAMRDMQHRMETMMETLEASVAVLEGAPSAPDAPAPASCSSARSRSSTASQGVERRHEDSTSVYIHEPDLH